MSEMPVESQGQPKTLHRPCIVNSFDLILLTLKSLILTMDNSKFIGGHVHYPNLGSFI